MSEEKQKDLMDEMEKKFKNSAAYKQSLAGKIDEVNLYGNIILDELGKVMFNRWDRVIAILLLIIALNHHITGKW